MENKILKFFEDVEIAGSVCGSNTFDLDLLDDIIAHLKPYWHDEEVVIYCSPRISSAIRLTMESIVGDGDFGVFEVSEFKAVDLLCEGSFYRGGFTFHIIEKPMEDSLWVVNSLSATPRTSLILKMTNEG